LGTQTLVERESRFVVFDKEAARRRIPERRRPESFELNCEKPEKVEEGGVTSGGGGVKVLIGCGGRLRVEGDAEEERGNEETGDSGRGEEE
jgi:hypothetical protein